jgi:hypothetical protein
LLGVVCIVLAISASLWFWSTLITIRPLKLITAWEQNDVTFEQPLAIKLIPRLEQSLAINPLRAESYLTLARLYEQLAYNSELYNHNNTGNADTTNKANGPTPNQQQNRSQGTNQKYLNLAELNYKKAIQQQPTWHYPWARLAALYSQNHRQKKLTLQVLRQAMLLGPYENETQKILIPLIFEHWTLLNEMFANIDQMNKILRHALKFNISAHVVLHAAKQFNKLDELAPLLSKKWHKNWVKKFQRELANQLKLLENKK